MDILHNEKNVKKIIYLSKMQASESESESVNQTAGGYITCVVKYVGANRPIYNQGKKYMGIGRI